ncbi:MAG: YkoF family thiamine/hydroxymethylpyrimidine-binding protein [Anaerolineae bacterium]
MVISAQVSVYPLGQQDLAPAIEAVWQVFQKHGLPYEPGIMSTLAQGDEEAVFAALRDAFHAASQYGATVMVATVSNACPRLPPKGENIHA